MAVEVIIPELGESVSEVILLEWLKQEGQFVERDEPICVLETDKANVDLPAPAAGVLTPLKAVDDTLEVGAVIAQIEEGAAPAAARGDEAKVEIEAGPEAPDDLSPAVRRLVKEHDLDPAQITGTGKGGRVSKADVMAYLEAQKPAPAAPSAPLEEKPPAPAVEAPPAVAPTPGGQRREPMTKIRQRIASRLVAAQQSAAMLTTFNEVDLGEVMALRKRHRERFAEVHGVSLGLMSFFSRAVVLALAEFETINASIEGTDIIYHDYVNLGIAVSAERGLVVPVLRRAEQLSMAQIEKEIKRLAQAARDNRLGIDELSGGTFTITNGGVFGSLMSTPILNPPQCGILGMHAIKERPAAVDGKVEVRPMMYLALSYDHRLVDGQQSVSFLVRIKEFLEDPGRMMLEV